MARPAGLEPATHGLEIVITDGLHSNLVINTPTHLVTSKDEKP